MNLLKRLSGKVPEKAPAPVTTISKPIIVHKMSQQRLRRATSDFYDPRPQPFFAFKDGTWQMSSGNEIPTYTTLPTIKLLSWNIDFQASAAQARMERALDYLHELVSAIPPDTPSIILLQEITSSDLDVVQGADWIQKHFHLTDLSARHWLSHYGTITLVDRRLRISSVFRVRFESDMGRDALFVDVEDATPTTLRFCNAHLESLVARPPLRPAQVALASRYLKDPTVDGGVVAGDFNAIQDFDKTLHAENGLKDAYLESGGEETDQDGFTWGMQSWHGEGERYGSKRLDKVLFCGRVEVQNLEKIGAGIQIEGTGAGQYVTDHLGLMADVVSEDD